DVCAQGETRKFSAGYAILDREWRDGDEITVDLHMGVKRILPPEGAVNGDAFAAYQYGPLVLAADKRIADPDGVIDVVCDGEGMVDFRRGDCPEIKDAHICLELPTSEGKVRLIDYASAGKTWTDESRCAAWLYRKK
ncbi:MAG: glycoside hydrolase family 127 protein, partial [Kiritimatiellae bacterium]|nr:glycoside hydrolase family 127 protein [Kiritimatiellia bacterium]